MDFKQKAEEKKMSMSKNIARLAVTAGLTAALSFGGVMAPVTMAFAAGTPTVAESGNVTIKEDTYKDTTFKGIQIFKAKVTQDKNNDDWSGSKTLSDITWASEDVERAVTGAFGDDDTTKPSDNDAQKWADWLKTKTEGEYKSGTDKTTKLDAGTTLDKIAKALEDANITEGTDKCQTSTDGTFTGLNTGYWLFVTKSVGKKPNAVDKVNTDTFTSPIFAVVGGSAENLTPKKQIPTVTKAVKDDNNGSFVTDKNKDVFEAPNRVADSASDQLIEYQLAGTVASNINSYKEYSYTFTDGLPFTMVPELKGNEPVVEVKIGNQVVYPGSYSKEYANGKLVVSFSNLKNAHAKNEDGSEGAIINVDGSSKVYVNYKAKLDPTKVSADILGKGQKNTVTLTYSNNPHDNGDTGTTVDHPAYDYTYGIDVTKVGNDKDATGNLKKLKDVEFTLQEVVDGNAESQYIDTKGVKHDNAKDATLKTTAEGEINVVGLDEGTYILKEVTPAPGYNNSAANGVTFTIGRELNQTGGEVIPSVDSAIRAADGVVKDNTASASTGKLSFTIVDQKGSSLPLTGLNGVTFTWIAGGAVLCIGVAHLIRSRKQAEESEQE